VCDGDEQPTVSEISEIPLNKKLEKERSSSSHADIDSNIELSIIESISGTIQLVSSLKFPFKLVRGGLAGTAGPASTSRS